MAFSVLNKIDIKYFLELTESTPVIDVRSPAEYKNGHIPAAKNVPLFDDRQRELVGISYKHEGRDKAIIKGLELIGNSIHLKLQEALSLSEERKLLVHCWRGGMRSEAMAWLFSLGDIKTEVLDGGYKAYRHQVLDILSKKRKVIILGGMTGSSKTHILRQIGKNGHQFIDLEDIANHKGSAFGALGQYPQPSSEHFANLLFDRWRESDPQQPLWLEDESRNIGTVFMPDTFYNNMQAAPAIILLMDREKRLPRLIEEYSTYPPEHLIQSVMKIKKRLGGDNTSDAVRAIETGDFAKAIEITLMYYDKAYMFGIKRKPSGNIIYVETDTDNIEENTQKVLKASEKITL
jgi:tRNA 2-selenouridine synthase